MNLDNASVVTPSLYPCEVFLGKSVSRSFSVVTVNYNMGNFLTDTIESVLQNLRPGDQYFVIDGGSTDDSVKIIRSYEGRLTGWLSEPDGGYADAIGKGFSWSSGALQCWINSGDILLSGALDNARHIIEQSGVDFIFGDDFYIDEKSNVICFSKGYVRSLRKMMLFGGWTPLQDACFWRRSLYERVGGIDRGLKHAADFDLFLRFTLQGRIAYIPIAFSAFRRHEGQKSILETRKYREERERCRLRELEKLRVSRRKRKVLELCYWMLVRSRVHVMHRLWKIGHRPGAPVRTLRSQAYII
jgi:glycosyltransferase involved in cell wall biosynthesis